MDSNNPMKLLLEGKQSIWLPVLSGSMAPVINPGDEIYIIPHFPSYKFGDIAVFFNEGEFYSHRIILTFKVLKKVHILEKGDANRHARFISGTKVLGRVTKLRRGKNVISLNDPEEEAKAKKTALNSILSLLTKDGYRFLKRKLLKWR